MVAGAERGSASSAGADRASRTQTIVNWVLAILTALGATAVVLLAYGLVLGTAACSDRTCPHLGEAETVFGPVVYGAPVISLLTIAASFVTARQRRGWMVPALAWVLLIICGVLLAVFLRG